MRWWRRNRKPEVTVMLDEHLSRKGYEERAKLREKHKEKLYALEAQDLPKDAVIIKRKDFKGFIAGFVITIFLIAVIGSAYAVFYAGNQQIISTVTTGTAPITVASTTKVTNLNADYLDGYDSSTFLRASCQPYEASGSATIAGATLVSCTSCKGWILGMAVGANPVDNGGGGFWYVYSQMNLTIDGVKSIFTNYNEYSYYHYKGLYTHSRFTTNMSARISTTAFDWAGSTTTYGVVHYCLE